MNANTASTNGRVTVVLPTYNRAELLPRAIETALQQTAVNRCDIVVVDDGSADRTPAVAGRYKGRIIYIRQPNGGLGAARNTGIRARRNEFVALLDDDDLWEPDKIDRQLEAFGRWPEAVLVAGRSINQFPDGRQELREIPQIPMDQPVDLAPLLFEDTFLPPSSVMVRTRTLYQVGLFHTRLRGVEDYHMWARMACRGPFVHLEAPVATYCVGTPGAYSNDTTAMQTRQLRARYALQSDLRLRPDCRPNWERGLARSLTSLRDGAYQQRRYATAARYGLRSLLHQPWRRPRWEWVRFFESAFRAAFGPTARHSHAGRRR